MSDLSGASVVLSFSSVYQTALIHSRKKIVKGEGDNDTPLSTSDGEMKTSFYTFSFFFFCQNIAILGCKLTPNMGIVMLI